ncbi:MAG: UDP-2,4-diacetamido-2,4,6-trideoxy-beta-L-altropyranose hydrolase, partial [Nitrospiraceae bacterium]
LCRLINKKNFTVYKIPNQDLNSGSDINVDLDAEETCRILSSEQEVPDWLIVDHYSLGEKWERRQRPHVKKIMVIDDLADRSHDCDLLLDQNLYENMENRYNGLVPDHCIKFLGPRYAFLRSEFFLARQGLRLREGQVKKILVFFGGTDPGNQTVKTLEALRLLNSSEISVDVVVGQTNPYRAQVKKICSDVPNFYFFCQVQNMAQLMVNADLAIGAGGVAVWERCYLGLPALILVVAQNQSAVASAVAGAGAARNLGWSAGIRVEELSEAIKWAIDNPDEIKRMSKKALDLMGGSISETNDSIIQALMAGE